MSEDKKHEEGSIQDLGDVGFDIFIKMIPDRSLMVLKDIRETIMIFDTKYGKVFIETMEIIKIVNQAVKKTYERYEIQNSK